MPFSDFIEKLQNKPRQTRIKILWGAVIISTLIIVPFWFFSFKHSLSKSSQPKTDNKEINELTKSIKEIGGEIPSLKKSLQASISSFFEKNDFQSEDSSAETLPAKSDQIKKAGWEIKPDKLPLSE